MARMKRLALRPLCLTAVFAAAAVVLAACSASTEDPGAAAHTTGAAETAVTDEAVATTAADAAVPTNHNAADVTFATDMIPHHRQALTLTGLVDERTDNAAVIALAREITAAQQPEIDQLQAMLRQWDVPVPEEHQEDHDGADMAGMVDQATLGRLESLRGSEFDTLWLESMISHHQGAVQMSQTEIADGENAAAKALATNIIAVQQAEIDQMNDMMGA